MRFASISGLVFCTAIASELFYAFDDFLEIYGPVHSYVVPAFAVFWVPVFLVVLWFNAVARGGGRFLCRVEPAFIAAFVLILSMVLLEVIHALTSGTEPGFKVVFAFVWPFFAFIVLRSFDYFDGWSDTMVVVAAVCAAAISVGSIVFPFRSIADLGVVEFFTSVRRPEWDGVNSHAYFAAAVVLFAFHRIFFAQPGSRVVPSGRWRVPFWVVIALVNLVGIVANKSRGAWIAVILGIIVLVVARITGWRGYTFMLFGVVAALALLATVWIAPSPVFEKAISLGRGLQPAMELKLHGRDESEILRTGVAGRAAMATHSLEMFRQSPLFGLGWAAVRESRIEGHAIHGIPQLVLACYGLVGFVLFSVLIYLMLPSHTWAGTCALAPVLLLVILVSSLARGSIPLWYAIIFAMLASSSSNDLTRC